MGMQSYINELMEECPVYVDYNTMVKLKHYFEDKDKIVYTSKLQENEWEVIVN